MKQKNEKFLNILFPFAVFETCIMKLKFEFYFKNVMNFR